MLFEERTEAGKQIFRILESRLDAHIADVFRDTIQRSIADTTGSIILDLSLVDFIDSSGLGAIVSFVKKLGGKGTVSICCLRDAPKTAFKLTRLNQVMPLYDSVDEALSAGVSSSAHAPI